MKHCLLNRKEERYELTEAKADKVQNFLLTRKYLFQQIFFGCETTERMNNFVFDVPKARDMFFYQRETYTRARFRRYYTQARFRNYYTDKFVSGLYGEWRIKKGDKVIKKRKEIKTDKQYSDFLKSVEREGLVPVAILDYVRTAFNSKDDKIRITIDRDISYTTPDNKNDLTQYFFKRGKPAIIKVKTTNGLPLELEKLFSKLPKRQMTRAK